MCDNAWLGDVPEQRQTILGCRWSLLYSCSLAKRLTCLNVHHLAMLFTETTPTHSAKSDWADSKQSSSFAAESEAFIELGQKKDDDAKSIKEGDLEMKLTTIDEKAEDTKDDIDKPTAVTDTSFGLGDVIVGTITEDEKSKGEDTEPKDEDKDEIVLTTTATTLGVQNDSDAANGKDSNKGN